MQIFIGVLSLMICLGLSNLALTQMPIDRQTKPTCSSS
jgi:hypothetical protein